MVQENFFMKCTVFTTTIYYNKQQMHQYKTNKYAVNIYCSHKIFRYIFTQYSLKPRRTYLSCQNIVIFEEKGATNMNVPQY